MTTPSVTKLNTYLNRIGSYRPPRLNMKIMVKVIDARLHFGKTQFLITPVHGEGEDWVEERQVDFVKQTALIDDGGK